MPEQQREISSWALLLAGLRFNVDSAWSTVDPELQQRLLQLSVPLLEDLGEALLDCTKPDDLIAWLDQGTE